MRNRYFASANRDAAFVTFRSGLGHTLSQTAVCELAELGQRPGRDTSVKGHGSLQRWGLNLRCKIQELTPEFGCGTVPNWMQLASWRCCEQLAPQCVVDALAGYNHEDPCVVLKATSNSVRSMPAILLNAKIQNFYCIQCH